MSDDDNAQGWAYQQTLEQQYYESSFMDETENDHTPETNYVDLTLQEQKIVDFLVELENLSKKYNIIIGDRFDIYNYDNLEIIATDTYWDNDHYYFESKED